MLWHKVKFARACITVNINEPLQSYATVKGPDGKSYGNLIWYEDFYEGCSLCGRTDHSIEECPTLKKHPKQVTIQVKKAPVMQDLHSRQPTAFNSSLQGEQQHYTVDASAKLKSGNLFAHKEQPNSTTKNGKAFNAAPKKQQHHSTNLTINEAKAAVKESHPPQDPLSNAKGKAVMGITNPTVPITKPSNDDKGKEKELPVNAPVAQGGVEVPPEAAPSSAQLNGKNSKEIGDSIVKRVEAMEVEQPSEAGSTTLLDSGKKRGKEGDDSITEVTSLKRTKN